MNPAVTHLFFHSPCFDGIASAVICSDFLEKVRAATDIRLHPVGYDLRDDWLATSLPANSVVVDFLFHPAAVFWADHHETAFLRSSDRLRFMDHKASNWIYNPKARSCAAMLRTELRRRFGYRNARYDSLVDWANRIDSAAYRDVRQAVLAPTPALQISLTLAGAKDEYCEWLVHKLRAHSLSEVAHMRDVRRRTRQAKASLRDGLRLFKKSSYMEDGIVVFQLDARDTVVSRYAPYYFFPKAKYSVGLMRVDDGAKITAMRNPWRRFESVPIGQILAKHGGGGHQRVGSLLLRGDAITGADDLLTDVVAEIRERQKAQEST